MDLVTQYWIFFWLGGHAVLMLCRLPFSTKRVNRFYAYAAGFALFFLSLVALIAFAILPDLPTHTVTSWQDALHDGLHVLVIGLAWVVVSFGALAIFVVHLRAFWLSWGARDSRLPAIR